MFSTKGIAAIASAEDLKNSTDEIIAEVSASNEAVLIQDAGVVVLSVAAYYKMAGIKVKRATGDGTKRRGRPRKVDTQAEAS